MSADSATPRSCILPPGCLLPPCVIAVAATLKILRTPDQGFEARSAGAGASFIKGMQAPAKAPYAGCASALRKDLPKHEHGGILCSKHPKQSRVPHTANAGNAWLDACTCLPGRGGQPPSPWEHQSRWPKDPGALPVQQGHCGRGGRGVAP